MKDDVHYIAMRLWCDVYARVLVSDEFDDIASCKKRADAAVSDFAQSIKEGKFSIFVFSPALDPENLKPRI